MNLLKQSPIAVETEAANEQHYEIPAEFYSYCLGPRKKYSCCHWSESIKTLEDAEIAALELVCERAQLINGQAIFELGCGWGSLTLYMAEKYPNSAITALSNSHTQRTYIETLAKARGIQNIHVITGDFSTVEINGEFDRIVSIEMLEHVRNYEKAFQKLAQRLKPDGKMFVHVFGHRQFPYLFNGNNTQSWTAQNFFSGGQMPSKDLFSMFDNDLRIEASWTIDGTHYEKTAAAWLQNIEQNKAAVISLFKDHYGDKANDQYRNFRLFFLLVQELFGYNNGTEWQVYHYLFIPTKKT
ncbi:class I SAM-dependent methyltransferase [bacterium]|nr:class I SAM-dependent methyltransferase [bacterium]